MLAMFGVIESVSAQTLHPQIATVNMYIDPQHDMRDMGISLSSESFQASVHEIMISYDHFRKNWNVQLGGELSVGCAFGNLDTASIDLDRILESFHIGNDCQRVHDVRDSRWRVALVDSFLMKGVLLYLPNQRGQFVEMKYTFIEADQMKPGHFEELAGSLYRAGIPRTSVN